jgi:hypothetical protein
VSFSLVHRVGVAAALCLALAACGATASITQTPFEQTAGDGASIFSAAGETLRFVHADPAKFTVEYATGSMINYGDQVSSLVDELQTAQGAPDSVTVDRLVDLATPAVDAINDPCLEPGCDYQSQIAALDAARDALLAAVGQ